VDRLQHSLQRIGRPPFWPLARAAACLRSGPPEGVLEGDRQRADSLALYQLSYGRAQSYATRF
jgi:hypothetical protein